MRTQWIVAIAVASIVAVLASAGGYAYGWRETFTSKAMLTLSPRDPATVGADNLALAAARYQAFLISAAAVDAVAAKVGDSPAALSKGTTVLVQPQTVTIAITVTLPRAAKAAACAHELGKAAVARGRKDEIVTVELIVEPVVATEPTAPNRQLALVGAVLGVVAIVVASALLLLRRARTVASAG